MTPASSAAGRVDGFRSGLLELGYIDGKNLRMEFLWANTPERLPDLAAELVRRYDGPIPPRPVHTGPSPSHPYPIFDHPKKKNFVDLDEDLHLTDFINAYQEGYEAGAKNTFGAKLKAARPAVRNQQRRTAEGRKVRCYAGVELNSDGVDLLATWSGKPAVAARCKARLSQAVSG